MAMTFGGSFGGSFGERPNLEKRLRSVQVKMQEAYDNALYADNTPHLNDLIKDMQQVQEWLIKFKHNKVTPNMLIDIKYFLGLS